MKKFDFIFFLFLGLLCVVLAYTRNFPDRRYIGKYEIYTDKAYYYIYLPATFIYHWDVNKFPKNIDGERAIFALNYSNGKILSKMTCGIAILWTPFFLIAHSIALIFNLQPDGFSLFYEHFAAIPGAIFLVLGLFFLMKFLRRYYSTFVSYLTVLLVFLGTNLYYYSIDEGLMSHVNLFFLYSLLLFLFGKYLDSEKKPAGLVIGMSFTVALAVLIRPTSIIIMSCFFFIDIKNLKELKERIFILFRIRNILILIAAAFITVLPQLIYWKYLTGHFIYYSYVNETFSNWKNPPLLQFWFAPLNGLFLYSPLILIFLAGSIWMIIKKVPNGIFTLILFLFVSYVLSSWNCWYFVGFGSRSFVEYYAVLSIPFGFFLSRFSLTRNQYLRSVFILGIFLLVSYNLRMTYTYRYNTFSTWAWDDFIKKLDLAGIIDDKSITYTYINDFENAAMATAPSTDVRYHSATMGGILDPDISINGIYTRNLGTIIPKHIKNMYLTLWVNQRYGLKTGAVYQIFMTDSKQNVIFQKIIPIDPYIKRADTWFEIRDTVKGPEIINEFPDITFRVLNPMKSTLFIDDQVIRFE